MGYRKSDDLDKQRGPRCTLLDPPSRTKRVQLRVDPAEWERWTRAAKTEHRTVSEFIRVAVLYRADRTLSEGAEEAAVMTERLARAEAGA